MRTTKEEIAQVGPIDLTGAQQVEITVRHDLKVIWINIDGVCALRVCRIGELTWNGHKLCKRLKGF